VPGRPPVAACVYAAAYLLLGLAATAASASAAAATGVCPARTHHGRLLGRNAAATVRKWACGRGGAVTRLPSRQASLAALASVPGPPGLDGTKGRRRPAGQELTQWAREPIKAGALTVPWAEGGGTSDPVSGPVLAAFTYRALAPRRLMHLNLIQSAPRELRALYQRTTA
jgi:hypothetical protein